jgi:dihydrofolate reductase
MSNVRLEISLSLDGYVTARNPSLRAPMGEGGQVLHEWAFNADDTGRQVLAESQRSVGASIAGRRTYDRSIADWGANGPGSELRTPTFIVSHSQPDDSAEGGVYTFASSPEAALAGALEAAGQKAVDIFSADVGRQLLAAGRVDEIRIHLVPVLLGGGTRLFENLDDSQIRLRSVGSIESAMATYLRYAVLNRR